MEFVIIAVFVALVAMMGCKVPFRIHIIHEHRLPPTPPPQQVSETDQERTARENEALKKDIATALNNYFFDRTDDAPPK